MKMISIYAQFCYENHILFTEWIKNHKGSSQIKQ